ncbi:PREDICTED: cadherin-like protein 26 [Nipponia nippon]|uniref:cadherin-like protein 26 n=1 Tax=Nipponia nippon TaxID=128390 RepID=UPI0005112B86|nr:PREDICTED: cadherin-like protein 26 [Nipponia nippon]
MQSGAPSPAAWVLPVPLCFLLLARARDDGRGLIVNLRREAAAQASDCRKRPDLSPGAGTGGRAACRRCAQVEDLLQQVAELSEGCPKTPPPAHTEGRGTNNAEEWKLATARTSRRKRLSPKAEVLLQNRFSALQTEEEGPDTSGEPLELSKAARSALRVTTSATKKRRWVIVAGDSLLRDMETPICRPDALPRVVCCLLGARIRHVTERRPSLVQSTDYYPLLLFHVGTRGVSRMITEPWEWREGTLERSWMPVPGIDAQSLEKDHRSARVHLKSSTKEFQPRIDSSQLDSLRPLRRTKRTWVVTTIDVQEEDKGPFPIYAGQVFNNKAVNASVKYLISGPGVDQPPEIGLFSVGDDANGHVYVHRTIDREKTSTFQIRFDIVYRKTGELLDRPLFFKIRVKDINDNAPEFPKEEYSITIRENHSKDEPVFQVTALDKDEDGTANSQVSYSLSMQMPLSDGFTFNVDPTTGSIRLSRCLEYKTANSFKLLIKASDHGTPQLSSTATVNVAVEDANNYLPVFTRDNYQLQISAGQEHPAVLRLQVQDEDSPNTPAWRAKYRVTKGNEKEQFTIETDPDTNEGILSIIKPLNYEEDSEMTLVISVANEEPFFLCKNSILMISSLESTNTTVTIKVLESQRAPRFHPPILIVQKEDSMKPGRVFRRYPATSPDGMPNKIKYELARDPGGWLSIDENSGVLTVAKEFDQESPYVNNSLYTIIVRAIDHGIPPQTGTGTIRLYLSDIHDHMPTLVAPSLDVCHKKERTPLIIKAKSALAHSHSGPFTFELAEDSEDVKHNWKLGENFVSSIVLCRFYVVGSKSKATVLLQEGEQTLISYNEESRMSLFQAKLDTTDRAALPPVSVKARKEVIAEDALYASYKTSQVRHLDYIMQTVDKILSQKLYYQNTLEDYGAIYEPCRYAEEGELERSKSFCSVCIGREDLPVDFLDTLGPKFSALEEICQKRFPSLN